MNPLLLSPDAQADSHAGASNIAFDQCVQALRRTLRTTPFGWLVASGFAWGRAPLANVSAWLLAFAALWLLARALLRGAAGGARPSAARRRRLMGAAALDGLGWGSLGWLLMGFDPVLDSELAATLCGVAAVNTPVYITYLRAYNMQLSAMWFALASAFVVQPRPLAEHGLIVGLTLFFRLLAYYMQPISRRVIEGIGLQLSNASLAAQLSEALQLVRHESETDALTGQPNRRALEELLRRQAELARTSTSAFSVLLLDIDRFKQINDSHGHGVGDKVLRVFAERASALLRPQDVCARYGGEEFVVVLPRTTLAEASDVAERLRAGIAARPLSTEPFVRATVSIGAAQYDADETCDALLERADGAVYEAKRSGRNRVCVREQLAL